MFVRTSSHAVRREFWVYNLSMVSKRSIAFFWDEAVQIMYNEAAFVLELKRILRELGITKRSKILDASAGTGFPGAALLRDGYDITFNDASKEMLRRLKMKLPKNYHRKIYNLTWEKLPKIRQKYDLVFCRGNSLIYAQSWNKKGSKTSQRAIRQGLEGMRKILKLGGTLWVDINSADEFRGGKIFTEHFRKRGRGGPCTMAWRIEHKRNENLRIVRGEILSGGRSTTQDFYSYLLKPTDAAIILKKGGFSQIKPQKMKTEFYSIYTAKNH